MTILSRLPSIYRVAQITLDATVAALAILLAFTIRFEGKIPVEYLPLAKLILLIGIPSHLIIQGAFGVYRQIWRLFSKRDCVAIFQATSFYSLLLLITVRLLLPRVLSLPNLPLGVAFIDWGLCLLGMYLLRLLRSWQTTRQSFSRKPSSPARRVILIGAGRAGAKIVRETHESQHLNLRVVGFLDDDKSKLDRQVEGVKVWGKAEQLINWVRRLQADEVLITMPSARGDRIQQIVNLAKAEDVPIKILPRVQELLQDRSLAGQIRDIRLEDLLGRPEIFLDFDQTLVPDFPSATAQIRDRTVLVTGAGGTIGSELCRQIARLRPKQLVLVGRGENSIFHIDQELRRTFPNLKLIPLIADIRNQRRISEIFHNYYPNVIFHAAAHKHVPLMEQNPTEAIENNTIASANLATLAATVGASTFVLISTDKAVAPNNFMGLSKRLAEVLISAIAQESKTRFLAVRFGNVLGSRGSVVPIFQHQISKGGPVTVTDPKMTRYFMTTPEAVRLVIQSLAVGKSGQTLVLDMGEPMNIYSLAKQLIRLAGYTPGRDIDIKIAGIRPGEKLHETLVDSSEQLLATSHPKIRVISRKVSLKIPLVNVVDRLQSISKLTSSKDIWSEAHQLLELVNFHEIPASYINKPSQFQSQSG